jgi:hypothetical protein
MRPTVLAALMYLDPNLLDDPSQLLPARIEDRWLVHAALQVLISPAGRVLPQKLFGGH